MIIRVHRVDRDAPWANDDSLMTRLTPQERKRLSSRPPQAAALYTFDLEFDPHHNLKSPQLNFTYP